MFKYFFVGGSSAIVDIGLFLIFTKVLGFNYLIVAFFTFILATFVNYSLSIKYVFESGKKHKKQKEIILVYIVSSLNLVLNLFLLYIFHELLTFDVGVSKVLVTGLLFFYNYSMRRFFIFGV